MVGLGSPPGFPDSQAFALNNNGEVVGVSSASNESSFEATVWMPSGKMIPLPCTIGSGYVDSSALGVNDSGEVVGFCRNPEKLDWRAFAWTPHGGMIDLGILGGPYTVSLARGINDAGEITGNGGDGPYTTFHAFSWTPKTGLVDIGTLSGPDSNSKALSINNEGQIVALRAAPGLLLSGSSPLADTELRQPQTGDRGERRQTGARHMCLAPELRVRDLAVPFEMRCAADQVVEPVPQVGVAPVALSSSSLAAPHFRSGVEAACPERLRRREPQSAHDRQAWDEDAKCAELRLALEERDEPERQVDREDCSGEPVGRVAAGIAAQRQRGEQAEKAECRAHERRLDRAAALFRPVDVVEVEDQRELVERECGANPEERRQEEHRVVAGAERDDRSRRRKAREDSRDEMVEMDIAD